MCVYIYIHIHIYGGFPGCSAGKQSTYNAGDPGLIPAMGSPPEEGIGYLLQYSWVLSCHTFFIKYRDLMYSGACF